MINNMFYVPTLLPFLFFAAKWYDSEPPTISLCVATFPITEQNYDWYSYVELDQCKDLETKVRLLRNTVARRTRRAVANIVFVGNQQLVEQIKQLICDDDLTVVYDDNLSQNTIRATYWKVINNQTVDGGLQITDSGICYCPNWKAYFVEGTV